MLIENKKNHSSPPKGKVEKRKDAEMKNVSASGVGYSIPHPTNAFLMKTNTFFDYLKLTIPYKKEDAKLPLGFEIYTFQRLKAILEVLLKLGDNPPQERVTENVISYGNETRIIINGRNSKGKFVYKDEVFELDTIILELKGQGCRAFEERNGHVLFDLVFPCYERLYARSGRVDFDIDLINGKFTIQKLKQLVLNGYLVTNFKKMKPVEEYDIQKGLYLGEGLYFGSKSNIELLNYNKTLEFASRNIEVENQVESYLRFEMRFYHERADALCLRFLKMKNLLKQNENMLAYEASSILFGLLDFKDPEYKGKNEQKCRWPTWSLWQEFLDVASKSKVVNQLRLEKNISTMLEWQEKCLSRQEVIQLLSTIFDPEYKNFYSDLILKGFEKLKPTDIAMFNKHLEKKGLPPVTREQLESIKSGYVKTKEMAEYERYLNGEADATDDDIPF